MTGAGNSPYVGWMQMRFERVDDRIVAHLPWHDGLMGRPDFLHGGAMAGLLENAAFAVLQDALADQSDVRLKPISISVDFLRGGGTVESFATARIVRLGRRLANVEAWAWQGDEAKQMAIASIKFMLARDHKPA